MDKERLDLLLTSIDATGLHYKLYMHDWNKSGMSMTQLSILELLANEGSKRVKELAQNVQVTSGGVTLICDKMIQQGYVRRLREESQDRRSVFLEITEKGREVYAEMAEFRMNILSEHFIALTNDDLREWNRIYTKLNGSLLERRNK